MHNIDNIVDIVERSGIIMAIHSCYVGRAEEHGFVLAKLTFAIIAADSSAVHC